MARNQKTMEFGLNLIKWLIANNGYTDIKTISKNEIQASDSDNIDCLINVHTRRIKYPESPQVELKQSAIIAMERKAERNGSAPLFAQVAITEIGKPLIHVYLLTTKDIASALMYNNEHNNYQIYFDRDQYDSFSDRIGRYYFQWNLDNAPINIY